MGRIVILWLAVISLYAVADHTNSPIRTKSTYTYTADETSAQHQFLKDNFPLADEDLATFASDLTDAAKAPTRLPELLHSIEKDSDEAKNQRCLLRKKIDEDKTEGRSEAMKVWFARIRWAADYECHEDKAKRQKEQDEFWKIYDAYRDEKIKCTKVYNDTVADFAAGKISHAKAKEQLLTCNFDDAVLSKNAVAQYNDAHPENKKIAAANLALSGTNNNGRVVVYAKKKPEDTEVSAMVVAHVGDNKVPDLTPAEASLTGLTAKDGGFDFRNSTPAQRAAFVPKGDGTVKRLSWKNGKFEDLGNDWPAIPTLKDVEKPATPPANNPPTGSTPTSLSPEQVTAAKNLANGKCNSCHNGGEKLGPQYDMSNPNPDQATSMAAKILTDHPGGGGVFANTDDGKKVAAWLATMTKK